MKHFLLLLWGLITVPVFAQIQGDGEVYLTGEMIDARFNGGDWNAFSAFVNSKFDYSKVTKAGRMVASFTIDTDGKIKNIKITEVLDSASAMEMIRVLNLCPVWEPARRGGKPVSIDVKYPLVFKDSKG